MELLRDSNNFINLKGVVFVIIILFLFVFFLFFRSQKIPPDYNKAIEIRVITIKERITMGQSKSRGNYSKLVGWDVKWEYYDQNVMKTDSTIASSPSLNSNQLDKMRRIKVNSQIKVRYNKEGKSFIDLGE